MKICIVTTDLQGFIKNGGVGTAKANLAKYLSPAHSVDIIFCTSPALSKGLKQLMIIEEYRQQNINVSIITYPKIFVDSDHIYSYYSYLVYLQLKSPPGSQSSRYDKIIFPEMHGLGYYSMRAKQLKIDFTSSELITFFHGPSRWHVDFNNGIPTSFKDLMTYYIEKMTCQLADRVLFATQYSKQLALKMDYIKPSAKNAVLLFPFDKPGSDSVEKIEDPTLEEICFFGRLETRKGIETFLQAVVFINLFNVFKNLKITLIGSFGYINSRPAQDYINEWMKKENIQLDLITDYSKQEAIAYLKTPGKLAIICSKEETMGYTLIECITEKIPYLCSDIAPFVEVRDYLDPKSQNFFKVGNPIDLLRQIVIYDQNSASSTKLNGFDLKSFEMHVKAWNKLITQAEKKPLKKSIETKTNLAGVSFCIVYYDRPELLPQLLLSLKSIKNKEINIYINKSSTEESKKLLLQLNKNPAINLYFDKENLTPSEARNFLAKKSQFETLFFIDDDNILDTVKFNHYFPLMSRDWDVLVFTIAKFDHADYKHNERPEVKSHWLPIGNEISFNINENRIGDGNMLIKKSHFLKIGGFNSNLTYGEDQDLLLRSALNKGDYKICPESFILYRVHQGNLSRKGIRSDQQLNLQKSLLDSFNIGYLNDFFQVFQAWNFERDRNPGRFALNEILNFTKNPTSISLSDDASTQFQQLKAFFDKERPSLEKLKSRNSSTRKIKTR